MSASARPPRILYFTAIDISGKGNGGALVCREHVQRLCECGFDVHAATLFSTAPEIAGTLTSHCLPWNSRSRVGSFRKRFSKLRWPLLWERHAVADPGVNRAFVDLVQELRPNVVVVDYLPSLIWIPSVLDMPIPKIIITLNDEPAFQRDRLKRDGDAPGAVGQSILNWRLKEFQRRTLSRFDAVVALSEGDVPKHLDNKLCRVIPPVLDDAPIHWKYSGSRQVLFVGNIQHYPNRDAIEWIATRFAGHLASQDPAARIRIVGAGIDDVPLAWRLPNIQFAGPGNVDQLEDAFRDCDLFIAPIANPFGSKIKVLDCLSRGVPLVATATALTGVPFRNAIPQFLLDRPKEAALLVAGLLKDPSELRRLSADLLDRVADFRIAMKPAWGSLVGEVLAGRADDAPADYSNKP